MVKRIVKALPRDADHPASCCGLCAAEPHEYRLPKPLAGVESGLDKVAHLVAFTALAFSGHLGVPTRTALPFALLAYGGLIEVLQVFVPGRTAEWGDLLADGIGIGVGIVLAALVVRFRAEAALRQR